MSNEPKAGMSIDPEMLAAFIDKRLSPEQRAAVEAHLAADPDSYALLVETLKAQDELDKPISLPARQRSRTWVIAGSVLATAAAIALVAWITPGILQRVGGHPGLDQLAAAVGEERYVEARLSGGFKFGPVRSENRGPGSPSNPGLMAAVAAAVQSPSADGEGAHVAGVARLLSGDIDSAINLLEGAAGRTPSAAVHADLAAAYLERGRQGSGDPDYQRAFDAATRGLALENSHQESLFNRALAAERLGMPDAATYWSATAAATSDRAWRDEATRHIAALQRRP